MTPAPLTADGILTTAELAELLGMPPSTIADLARRGVLPSVKLGRRRLYLRAAVEAMLTTPTTTDREVAR